MDFIENFLNDNFKSGSISEELRNKILNLYDEYKLPFLTKNTNILCAEFGYDNFGSIVIRHVKELDLIDENENENQTLFKLKYLPGDYDYISIISDKLTKILWTDYSEIEPFNRQGCFYCDGASFESLGEPILKTEKYREFYSIDEYVHNISFAIWYFTYNTIFKSIKFSLCIEENKTEEFIQKLRKLINK